MCEGGRWVLANPRKIQNSNKPHKLNFSWGREFMMQSHMQHPGKSLRFFFALREYFQTSHLNSQTYIHFAMMNFKLVHNTWSLRNCHLSKVHCVFLQFCDWYLSKVQSPESNASCVDAVYLQFYAFQIWKQQMLPPKTGNNLLVYLLHNLISRDFFLKMNYQLLSSFLFKTCKNFPKKINPCSSQIHSCTFCKGVLLSFFFVLCLYL